MKTANDRLMFGIEARTKFYNIYTDVNINWEKDNTVCLVRIALSSNTDRMIIGKVNNDNTVTFKESIIAYWMSIAEHDTYV